MATINSVIGLQVHTYCIIPCTRTPISCRSDSSCSLKKAERKNQKETALIMTTSAAIKSRKILVFLQKQVDIVSYLT